MIEDSDHLCGAFVRGLPREGFAANGAGTGEGGLSRALVEDYDVLVLDLGSPGSNGSTSLPGSGASVATSLC